MNWKTKARIQNMAAVLPAALSYSVYYWMQRRCGGLRRIDPMSRLEAGVECWKKILSVGHDPSGKCFMEVGTGRVPILPIAYWLMGADRVYTLDLNPYLRAELTMEVHEYIRKNRDVVRKLFGELLAADRFDQLMAIPAGLNFSLKTFLEVCCIEYLAPADAAHTTFDDALIDFHTSHNVFEHIPPDVLGAILEEGNRIVKPNGLFVHKVDYSDHFSHSDKSISAINFLKYSDAKWKQYAGNRYMYMNRLRHDDFLELFQNAGHRIILAEMTDDPESRQLLESNAIKLDERFSGKSLDTLATSSSWIVSEHS